MKVISSKRNKTDADHEELSRLEFIGGLYLGSNGDGPVIPAKCIEGMIINAAKKNREGPKAKEALFCTQEYFPLQYDGPRDVDALWDDDRFVDIQPVKIQRSTIMRTRPYFETWALDVEVQFEDTIVNAAQVDVWFQTAGTRIGLCDYRPKYGRFDVEVESGEV